MKNQKKLGILVILCVVLLAFATVTFVVGKDNKKDTSIWMSIAGINWQVQDWQETNKVVQKGGGEYVTRRDQKFIIVDLAVVNDSDIDVNIANLTLVDSEGWNYGPDYTPAILNYDQILNSAHTVKAGETLYFSAFYKVRNIANNFHLSIPDFAEGGSRIVNLEI